MSQNVQNLSNSYQFSEKIMEKWKTSVILYHQEGKLKSREFNIKRGIFQGDSLSPLLFCLALAPLSTLLYKTEYSYKTKAENKVSHLLYMDDLKTFAKNDNEQTGILNTVKKFSDEINMDFGLEKCAKATFIKGKLTTWQNVQIDINTTIKDLEPCEAYKCLEMDEGDGIQHSKMKEKIRKECLRQIRSIMKTELNAKNIIAINTLALPIVTYSFNIINWNLNEIKRLDAKIGKQLTINRMHHPKADVDRLYIPRKKGGRGLIQLELSYKPSTIGLDKYLKKPMTGC